MARQQKIFFREKMIFLESWVPIRIQFSAEAPWRELGAQIKSQWGPLETMGSRTMRSRDLIHPSWKILATSMPIILRIFLCYCKTALDIATIFLTRRTLSVQEYGISNRNVGRRLRQKCVSAKSSVDQTAGHVGDFCVPSLRGVFHFSNIEDSNAF